MTLATHIVTGAAAAKIFSSHPLEAFVIGWISHYIMDSVVHWDYPLRIAEGSSETSLDVRNAPRKLIAYDVIKVLLDVLIGSIVLFILSWNFSPDNVYILIAGAFGAVIPDFLQFLYGVFKVRALAILQRFHHFMHAKKSLNGRPWIGVGTQVGIVLIATLLFAVL